MRFTDTQELFDDACEYPVEAATLQEQLGDVEIEAPTGDTETVAAVLARSNVRTYESSADAYTAMVGNLDESFIGRKYYDDRGGSLPDPDGFRSSD
jgi:hypothetical protein